MTKREQELYDLARTLYNYVVTTHGEDDETSPETGKLLDEALLTLAKFDKTRSR